MNNTLKCWNCDVRMAAIVVFMMLAGASCLAQDMLRLLPGNHEVKGWTRKTQPKTYEHQQLWEYIDGGADVYLDYGFQRVITEELVYGKQSIIVDIYDMSTLDGAFGMYARERAPSYHFVQIGSEGYLEGSALNFAQEQFYIKLTAYADDQSTKNTLEKLAQAVSKKIGGQRKPPAVFAFFPWQGKVKHTETYDVKSYLGKTDLRDTYAVGYNVKSTPITVFITVTSGDANANNRLKAFRSSLSQPGSLDKNYRDLSKTILTGKHKDAKEIVLALKGRYIVGAYPAANADAVKEVLGMVMKNLK
jgi:hypothetical protein